MVEIGAIEVEALDGESIDEKRLPTNCEAVESFATGTGVATGIV